MRRYIYLLVVFIFILSDMIPITSFKYHYCILGVLALLFAPQNNMFKSIDRTYYKWMLWWLSVIAISALWSIRPVLTIYTLFVNVAPLFMLTYSLTKYITSYQNLKTLISIIYICCCLTLVYLLLFVDFSMIAGQRLNSAFTDETLAEEWNLNSIGMNLALGIYGGFYIVRDSKHNIYKLIWLLLSVFMLFVIFVTGSRKALLILIIPLVIFALYDIKKHLLMTFLLSLVCFIILYAVMKIPFFYDIMGSRVDDLFNILSGNEDGTEDNSRKELINLGLGWFYDSPILGYGMNCFRALSNTIPRFAGRNFYAHNNYIETLVGVGLLGFFVFYSYVIMIYNKIKRQKEFAYRCVVAMLVILLFMDFALVSYYEVVIQIMIMIIFVIINLEKQKKYYKR